MAGLRLPWAAGMLNSGFKRPLTFTYNGFSTDSASSNTFTFTSEAIGTAPPAGQRRFVFVTVGTTNTTGSAYTVGVTIGGVSATALIQTTHSGGGQTELAGIFYREVATGTTATVVVTHNTSGGFRCGIGVYSVYSGMSGITVGPTYGNTIEAVTVSLTGSIGNFVIGTASSTNGGTSISTSGQNFTENYDAAKGASDDRVVGASGLLTINVTSSTYQFSTVSPENFAGSFAVITN